MREILFRGKRTDNGEWVYGYFVEAEKLDRSGNEHFIIEWKSDGATYEVDPSTVGQYTGLTDKNGVKIFEGDIVNCYDLDFSAKIEWDDENAMFGIVAEADCLYVTFDNYFGKDLEIIGNIHDNPELIER